MTKPIPTPKQNPPVTQPTAGTTTRSDHLSPFIADLAAADLAAKPPTLRPGFVHHEQQSMNEWSYGTRLTVFQMPVSGVVWAPDLIDKPGATHMTPMLAMRSVFIGDSIYFAFGTGPDNPTRLTLRIPRLALLTLLAKAESMDLRDQEKKTFYLDEDGNLLDLSPYDAANPEPHNG